MALLQYQSSLFDDPSAAYTVREIPKHDTHYLLLNVHYARRLPSITYAFGLFLGGELRGVVTYGSPPSPSLCIGLCGAEMAGNVLELNRLCLVDNKPNEASMLVGKSLKMLPPKRIIVSFADTTQDHLGVIYQATNFLYTGLTAVRNEWAIKGKEHLHSKTLTGMVAGSEKGSVEAIKEMFGDDFYYRPRSRKHRYVIFTGSKTDKKVLRNALKYPVLPYPKTQPDTVETSSDTVA